MLNETLYAKLNEAWKYSTKIILGGEIGELKEYEDILKHRNEGELISKPDYKHSKVITVPNEYSNLPVLDNNDIATLRRVKLNIDEIKDIDTIVERLKEEFLYTGSIVLGKSIFVNDSHKIIDSSYVYDSYDVLNSKFIAYSSHVRNQKYSFGIRIGSNAQFSILSTGFGGENVGSSRIFEILEVTNTSDAYYTVNCQTCQEVFFTFFKYGARYTIGNLQLSPDKYKKIKNTLLEEIRDNLKLKKHVSLFDLFMENTKERIITKQKIELELKNSPYSIPFSKEPINDAFKQTSKLLLKKSLEGDIDDYAEWLTRESPYYEYEPINSSIMNYPGHMNYKLYKFDKEKISKSYVTKKEGDILGKITLDENEINELSFKELDKLKEKLSKIYTITLSLVDNLSTNYDDVVVVFRSRHIYKSPISIISKFIGYTLYPRESSYQFGSSLLLKSEFGINVYNSEDIKRGFEVDNCAHSSDIYFSHNCEGSSDVMFCFNGKGLRNSIGHNILQRDKYLDIKAKLLEQIWQELNSKKTFKYGIYSLVR